MTASALRIGMKVRHPQYGEGTIKALTETTAEVLFSDAKRVVAPDSAGLEPAEPTAQLTALDMPLKQLVGQTVEEAIQQLGVPRWSEASGQLGARWHQGKLVLHPSDPTLQTKEVPLETFFHKIVMLRNNLRVLEQKINAHEKLTDGEKVDLQQYVTRCYGSLTTFNLLFKDKEEQF